MAEVNVGGGRERGGRERGGGGEGDVLQFDIFFEERLLVRFFSHYYLFCYSQLHKNKYTQYGREKRGSGEEEKRRRGGRGNTRGTVSFWTRRKKSEASASF